jgi:hypothetical protein
MILKAFTFFVLFLTPTFQAQAEVCVSNSQSPSCFLTFQLRQKLEKIGFAVEDISYGFPKFGVSLDGRPLATMSVGYFLERRVADEAGLDITSGRGEIAKLTSVVDQHLRVLVCRIPSGSQHDMFESGERQFINAGGVLVYDVFIHGFSEDQSGYVGQELTTVTLSSCEAP